MANEQAESSALESNDLAGLASFLDQPDEQESTEDDEQTVEESTGEADNEEATSDEQDIDPEDPDGESEDEPTPVEKITIKVKGEDGNDETLELTQDEIAKSYMRQKDYTSKTTALAQREDQAVKFLTQKHEEIRNQYLSQAELSRAAVAQMAGIKTESEMAQLANSDPAAWVAESQRQRQIGAFLNQLDQQINGEKQQAQAMQAEQSQNQRKHLFSKAWEELSKDGIDKPKLAKIYGDVTDKYGITGDELATVYDHRLVRMMKDATAYRALQAQKADVTKKVTNAPRMPQRQSNPAKERIDKALNDKFKSGRAKLNDLAAFLR